MSKLKLAHIYATHLNIYGDRGNVICLRERARWRGIDLIVDEINLGDNTKHFTDYDLLFIGGGQDKQQELVAIDLLLRKAELSDAIEGGAALLAICGGYQLLGHYYQNSHGEKTLGLGILDVYTEAAPDRSTQQGIKQLDRLVGNVKAKLLIELSAENPNQIKTLVGFENHSGRTFFSDGHKNVTALAKIINGHGNNDIDGFEGAVYKNVFCSYLHGSLLPKNPQLADELLVRAIKHNKDAHLLLNQFTKLNDNLELSAHEHALSSH